MNGEQCMNIRSAFAQGSVNDGGMEKKHNGAYLEYIFFHI